MRKVLIALSVVLLVLGLAACSGENPPPSTPEYPSVPVDPVVPEQPEPEEPGEEPREYIDFLDKAWVAKRYDALTNKYYDLEIIPNNDYQRSAVIAFSGSGDETAFDSSYEYRTEFYDKLYGIQYMYAGEIFDTLFYTVRYHDAAMIVTPGTTEVEYYPYYIRFAFVLDVGTPDCGIKPSSYNRLVYVTLSDSYSMFEDITDFGWDVSRLILVPTGTEEQNEYFTDEVKEQILKTWYDTIFSGQWKGESGGAGVTKVELVSGTPGDPQQIKFTIDEEIPTLSRYGLADRFPNGLVGIDFFERK